jgi:TatD DNase family protein
MGKKGKVKSPPEATLTLPTHPSLISLESKSTLPDIIDTHTHLLSTFKSYRSTYPSGVYGDLWAFVRGLYATKPSLQLAADSANGEATASGSSNEEQRYPITNLVDVWCEAPITKTWKEIADSASPEITGDSEEVVRSRWGGVNYWFVMGE